MRDDRQRLADIVVECLGFGDVVATDGDVAEHVLSFRCQSAGFMPKDSIRAFQAC